MPKYSSVAIDASILMLFLDAKAASSIELAAERVGHLIDTLAQDRTRIIVPTPALSECLVHAGPRAAELVRILRESGHFRIASFDERAAIELAARTKVAIDAGTYRPHPTLKGKAKFDHQIVAIAIVEGAEAIYSDDVGLCSYATMAGLNAHRLCDIDLPPEDPQRRLPFSAEPSEAEASLLDLESPEEMPSSGDETE